MNRNELRDGREVSDERGYASARRVRPGVLFMILSGYMREPFHTELIYLLNEEIANTGNLTMYVDAWDFENYESGFRLVWTAWFKKHQKELGVFPMLLRSKIVKMGVQVVNLATGGALQPVTSRAEFDRILRTQNITASRYLREPRKGDSG